MAAYSEGGVAMTLARAVVRDRRTLARLAALGLLGLAVPSLPAQAAEPPGAVETPVTQQPLPNMPGSSLTAVVVQLPPGARVPAHHHAGFVFAYVLAGTVRSQLNGGAATDYGVGQSWVEPPGTEHTLTANPSVTDPARLLAVFIAPTGAELTTVGR